MELVAIEWGIRPSERAHQGRLARSIRSEEPDAFAAPRSRNETSRSTLRCCNATAQTVDGEQRHASSSPRLVDQVQEERRADERRDHTQLEVAGPA